jgi:hypothetical protein
MSIPIVEVNQIRYDELLHKEALLETIEKLYDRTTDYVFRDAVGHLFHATAPEGKADE